MREVYLSIAKTRPPNSDAGVVFEIKRYLVLSVLCSCGERQSRKRPKCSSTADEDTELIEMDGGDLQLHT